MKRYTTKLSKVVEEILATPAVVLYKRNAELPLYAVYQKIENGYLCLVTNSLDNLSGKPVYVTQQDFVESVKKHSKLGWTTSLRNRNVLVA